MGSLYIFQLIFKDPAGEKHTFEILPGANLIGRQPGVALLLDQIKVSRHHAKIDCDGQECFLTDLNSANGTRLDGKRIQPSVPYPLAPGALIGIGDYNIVFEQVQAERPQPVIPVESEGPAALETHEMLPEQEGVEPEFEAIEKIPPPEMAVPPGEPPSPPTDETSLELPGMDGKSRFLINFLPEIYRTNFMECFLGIFESVLLPIEWNIDNFDLYLSPRTAPASFLPWLASWFGLVFDPTWTETQRRKLLAEANQLYAMRGTRWALGRLLEIYTGQLPVINDTGKDLKPYTFTVRLPAGHLKANQKFIQRLIEQNKPAHTTFVLEFEE